jgi:3-deoxy-D-manno-octulosonic-acid transferase
VHSTGAGAIWLHAVSVGEVLSSIELIRYLRSHPPRAPIYVSTATLAGRATAEQRLQGLADAVFYAPIDYRSCIRRVLRRLRPAAVVVLETEIWPNLYREAKRAGASLMIVNGRISDRALPRYRRFRFFFRHALALPDAILVQSEEDLFRYVNAGAPVTRVRVAGNLKYDFEPPGQVPAEVDSFLDKTWPEAVWIAASTMPPAESGDPDEDDSVIAAFAGLAKRHSRLLLILAPRKPERFEAAAQKLERAGISFVRRTQIARGNASVMLPGVLLLDTIGELAPLFERAHVVFMGGTLARRGGHNLLEPAYFGKPVVLGPHMENFAAIDTEFSAGSAVVKIAGASQLAPAVHELLQDRDRARAVGERARAIANAKRGAVRQVAQQIVHHASLGLPDPMRTLPARLILTPLSWIWTAAHRIHLGQNLLQSASLSTKVISVGGLSMGGTGKTPLVAHLARRLADAGFTPAILTRGYRRRSSEPIVVVPRGTEASVDLTGDEAQILVRTGAAHVGIGAGRLAVGHRVELELKPDVFLLDDGFQHLRLKRDQDVVLIDALDPLAGGMFPLGRRREPLSSLARATAVVVTRTGRGQEVAGIERLVRRYNRRAPIFRSRVVPREWVDLEWGTSRAVHEAETRRVAAFCGLGNPQSFWRTLYDLDLEVVFRWAFGDHHRYRPIELKRFSRLALECGAEAIVTTEKDSMNLCDGAIGLVAPLRLYWLRIGVEIDNEEEFFRLMAGKHNG